MKTRYFLLLSLLMAGTLSVTACSSSDDSKDQKKHGTVFDAQLKTLDKAKAVDKTMKDQRARMDAELKKDGADGDQDDSGTGDDGDGGG